MQTTAEPVKEDRAKQQAIAQCESIMEMVRAMDRETAVEDYAKGLDRAKCVELLTECGIECRDDESLEELRDAVAVNVGDSTCEPPDFEFDEDSARETIQEDALEICVRSGWVSDASKMEPEEFVILLCTGGPAVRIRGELSRCEPSDAWLEYQDWGTPWTRLYLGDWPQGFTKETLLAYCQQFYFGA